MRKSIDRLKSKQKNAMLQWRHLKRTKLVPFNVAIYCTNNTYILSTSPTSKGFRNETSTPRDLTHILITNICKRIVAFQI